MFGQTERSLQGGTTLAPLRWAVRAWVTPVMGTEWLDADASPKSRATFALHACMGFLARQIVSIDNIDATPIIKR
jgi:hypothetical protein